MPAAVLLERTPEASVCRAIVPGGFSKNPLGVPRVSERCSSPVLDVPPGSKQLSSDGFQGPTPPGGYSTNGFGVPPVSKPLLEEWFSCAKASAGFVE